jgi:hypothetical protein
MQAPYISLLEAAAEKWRRTAVYANTENLVGPAGIEPATLSLEG